MIHQLHDWAEGPWPRHDPEVPTRMLVAAQFTNSSEDTLGILRTAFAEMWKDPQFLADYSRVIKTEPIFVSGSDGQEVLADRPSADANRV
jgi:hypothetical protein